MGTQKLFSSGEDGWGWKGVRRPTQQLKKLYLPSNLQAKAKSALKGSYILNERKQFKFCRAQSVHMSLQYLGRRLEIFASHGKY